jgi:hypothetical protein
VCCIVDGREIVREVSEHFTSHGNIAMFYFLLTFSGKIKCSSVMDTIGLRAPTKQIGDFATLNMYIVSGLRLFECATANICLFLRVLINMPFHLRIPFFTFSVLIC